MSISFGRRLASLTPLAWIRFPIPISSAKPNVWRHLPRDAYFTGRFVLSVSYGLSFPNKSVSQNIAEKLLKIITNNDKCQQNWFGIYLFINNREIHFYFLDSLFPTIDQSLPIYLKYMYYRKRQCHSRANKMRKRERPIFFPRPFI